MQKRTRAAFGSPWSIGLVCTASTSIQESEGQDSQIQANNLQESLPVSSLFLKFIFPPFPPTLPRNAHLHTNDFL